MIDNQRLIFLAAQLARNAAEVSMMLAMGRMDRREVWLAISDLREKTEKIMSAYAVLAEEEVKSS